jgi:chemotaxis-related protein WspB
MLFVIVGIDRDKYAIPACEIIEIAPSVPSKNNTGTSRGVAGLIEYRGRVIPLLDLGELCRGVASAETPTTRILIVRPKSNGGLLGIRAERVTSTARIDDGAFEAVAVSGPPYMTGVALSGGAIIQRIDLDCLLGENVLTRQ